MIMIPSQISAESFLDEDEWLKDKRCNIGSSDARVLLGCGYAEESEYSVWDRIVNGVKKSFDESTLTLLRQGQIMEPAIIRLFENDYRNEYKVEPNKGFTLIRNRQYPNLCCTLDATVICISTGERGVLEAKFEANGSWIEYEDGKCPLKHFVQVQHQLICTGYKFGYLISLLKGRPVVRRIERDETLIEQMLKIYDRFMANVFAKTPPNGAHSVRYETVAGSSDEGVALQLGGKDSDMVSEILRLQEIVDDSERKLKRYKGTIATVSQGCRYLILADQRVVRLRKNGLEKVNKLPRGVLVK